MVSYLHVIKVRFMVESSKKYEIEWRCEYTMTSASRCVVQRIEIEHVISYSINNLPWYMHNIPFYL
jgi:hypothetical protein